MRLGLIARMDDSGLGNQTKAYYDHLNPVKTMVVDISALERLPDRVMRQHPEWYPDGQFIYGFPTDGDIREFLQDLDVVLIAESAYNSDLYRIAKEMKVRTANVYNYEFFDWFIYPFVLPDLFIAPSTWHYTDVETFCQQRGVKHIYLHVPVDRSKVKFRQFGSATSFTHIAGRPAAHDRNGTKTFLEAVALSEGQISATVYTQDKNLTAEITRDYPRVRVKEQVGNYADIYKKGSVLVLPRRYGGNCLPMNEALSAGMPVIMSDLSPQNEFLPKRWLVGAKESDVEFTPRIRIPVYDCSAYELYLKMRWFKSLSTQDMQEQNQKANDLAESISWEVMKPKYQAALEELL